MVSGADFIPSIPQVTLVLSGYTNKLPAAKLSELNTLQNSAQGSQAVASQVLPSEHVKNTSGISLKFFIAPSSRSFSCLFCYTAGHCKWFLAGFFGFPPQKNQLCHGAGPQCPPLQSLRGSQRTRASPFLPPRSLPTAHF